MINTTAQEGKMQGTSATIYSVLATATGAANTTIDADTNSAAPPPPSCDITSIP